MLSDAEEQQLKAIESDLTMTDPAFARTLGPMRLRYWIASIALGAGVVACLVAAPLGLFRFAAPAMVLVVVGLSVMPLGGPIAARGRRHSPPR